MVELLIKNGYVLTLDPERRVISDGAVAVDEGRIVALGKTRTLEKECKGGRGSSTPPAE